jgi:hypothetical protein
MRMASTRSQGIGRYRRVIPGGDLSQHCFERRTGFIGERRNVESLVNCLSTFFLGLKVNTGEDVNTCFGSPASSGSSKRLTIPSVRPSKDWVQESGQLGRCSGRGPACDSGTVMEHAESFRILDVPSFGAA